MELKESIIFILKKKKNNEFVNKHLYNSIEKYGFNAFEVYEEFDKAYTKEELNVLEEKYIRQFNSTNRKYGYNIKNGGDNRKLTEKEKFMHSIRIGKPLRCKQTKEIFLSINEAARRFDVGSGNLGFKIRKYNEAIIEKDGIRYKVEPLSKKHKPVVDLEKLKIYYSINEVSKITGKKRETISKMCKRSDCVKNLCFLSDLYEFLNMTS